MATVTTPTLLQLAGADPSFPKVGAASLVLIDLQNEYLAGPLALPSADAAIANAARLLAGARNIWARRSFTSPIAGGRAACSIAAPRAAVSCLRLRRFRTNP
jgi:nicotinamidase-related amidase